MSAWALEQLLQQLADPNLVSAVDEAYDLALARSLATPERETLIGRLIDASREGDGRAVLTLGYIEAVETLPALIALAKSDAPLATLARRAVAMMGRGDAIADELALNVLQARSATDRIESLKSLARLDAPLVRPTLQHALGDVDYGMRTAAWDALVEVYGLKGAIAGPDGKRASTTHIELANALLGSDIEAFAHMGIDEARWVFRRLDAGATPASLGIAYVAEQPEIFDEIRGVLFDEERPFPVDAIARLTGVQRRWAEMMIAMRLENEDARAPAALQRLGAVWTLPGLVEYARDREDAAVTDAIAALQSLARNGWLLFFDHPGSTPVPALEAVVSRVIGHPTVVASELSGNPRDFYARDVTITAHDPEAAVYLSVNVLQTSMGEGDPNPSSSINGAHLYMRGLSDAQKRATYQALRDELAELGYTDRAPFDSTASGTSLGLA